jgi:hypothetical protein
MRFKRVLLRVAQLSQDTTGLGVQSLPGAKKNNAHTLFLLPGCVEQATGRVFFVKNYTASSAS